MLFSPKPPEKRKPIQRIWSERQLFRWSMIAIGLYFLASVFLMDWMTYRAIARGGVLPDLSYGLGFGYGRTGLLSVLYNFGIMAGRVAYPVLLFLLMRLSCRFEWRLLLPSFGLAMLGEYAIHVLDGGTYQLSAFALTWIAACLFWLVGRARIPTFLRWVLFVAGAASLVLVRHPLALSVALYVLLMWILKDERLGISVFTAFVGIRFFPMFLGSAAIYLFDPKAQACQSRDVFYLLLPLGAIILGIVGRFWIFA